MKNAKSIALIIILFVFSVSIIGRSQDNKQTEEQHKYKYTPEEQAKKFTDRMKERLDLTDEQYSRIMKLQTDRITYRRELRSKDLISKSEIRQKREEFRNGMKSILTEDQQKKMKNWSKSRHKMKNRNFRK